MRSFRYEMATEVSRPPEVRQDEIDSDRSWFPFLTSNVIHQYMHSSVYLCIFGASCPLYGYSRFGSDIKQPLRTPFGDIILGADNHDRVISGDGAKHAFDGLLIDDAGHILRGAGWRVHDHEITCRGTDVTSPDSTRLICCSVLASGLEAGCSSMFCLPTA